MQVIRHSQTWLKMRASHNGRVSPLQRQLRLCKKVSSLIKSPWCWGLKISWLLTNMGYYCSAQMRKHRSFWHERIILMIALKALEISTFRHWLYGIHIYFELLILDEFTLGEKNRWFCILDANPNKNAHDISFLLVRWLSWWWGLVEASMANFIDAYSLLFSGCLGMDYYKDIHTHITAWYRPRAPSPRHYQSLSSYFPKITAGDAFTAFCRIIACQRRGEHACYVANAEHMAIITTTQGRIGRRTKNLIRLIGSVIKASKYGWFVILWNWCADHWGARTLMRARYWWAPLITFIAVWWLVISLTLYRGLNYPVRPRRY